MKIKESSSVSAWEFGQNKIINEFIINIRTLSEQDAKTLLTNVIMGLGDTIRTVGLLSTFNQNIEH